jgi:Rrf2 family protein
MSVNSQFTVAIHVLALLAMKQDEPLSSKFIAESVNTNPVVIRRIIGLLTEAGLVDTQMGAEGGTTLRVSPSEISLLAVYHATQQGPVFPMHAKPPNTLCPTGSNIQDPLQAVYDRAEAAMEAELHCATIQHILDAIYARIEG